jgi:hypothetical protein
MRGQAHYLSTGAGPARYRTTSEAASSEASGSHLGEITNVDTACVTAVCNDSRALCDSFKLFLWHH